MVDRDASAVSDFSITLDSVRFWDIDWQSFSQSHPEVARLVTPVSPQYCVPSPAVNALARGRGTAPPLFDKASAEAERKFADLCQKHGAVGCWPDRPIPFAPLGPRPAAVDASVFRQMGWTRSHQLHAQQALEKAEEAALRLKGYAGWLLTEPAFLVEVSALRDRWDALPEGQRPSFPLIRVLALPVPVQGTAPATLVVATFAAAVQQLLDRWGLMQLTTRDLPDPQGPLLPNPLPPSTPAMPTHGVHLILPLHYPLQGDDGLLDQILCFQRQRAREQGLDESLAGLPHHKAYANMLDVLHLERVIRARCSAGRRPRGLVSRIEEAIAAVLGGSLAQVQKLRKAITACQRGQRARVAWLRPRHP